MVIKQVPKVYIVEAHAEDVDRARRTRRNFPKTPAAGTPGAAAANAAPVRCHGTYHKPR